MHDTRSSFQDIADEAFADLLKKHKPPVGLMASLNRADGITKGECPHALAESAKKVAAGAQFSAIRSSIFVSISATPLRPAIALRIEPLTI